MKKTVSFLRTAAILFLLICLLSAPLASAADLPQVVIINQVRGTECCDPGTLSALQQQIATAQKLQLPTHFNLRYDALTDAQMMTTLLSAVKQTPHLIQLGLLIEITPSLAQAAGVSYTATDKEWYEAQHVFTLGYSAADRKKLVDTLFQKFHQLTGAYPTLTTGWIIDTPTLMYMHEQYAVVAHQITREQFGVDSYTLVGGPAHYPYPASNSWAFMPDYDQKKPLWILRQTVTDPLGNYGDTSSSFTSQPNDYARANRPFSYFTQLIDQALFQQTGQIGFALVGLENSMNEGFQKAYAEQLNYIAKLTGEGRATVVFANTVPDTYATQKVSIYGGHNLVTGDTNSSSYFITTPRYRIRLRVEKDSVFISDVRVYTPRAQDYYASHSAVKHSYWIAPFLLDASRSSVETKSKPSLLARLFGPPVIDLPQFEPHPDSFDSTTQLKFPQKNAEQLTVSAQPEAATFTLHTQDGTPYTLTFLPEKIIVTGLKNSPEYRVAPAARFPIKYEKKGAGFVLSFAENTTPVLTSTCRESVCNWQFTAPEPATLANLQSNWYPFFLPESKPRTLSAEKTVLYAHNRYALAGRNPARLVLFPFDEHGFPALHEDIAITSEPKLAYSSVEGEGSSGKSTTQFIDLVHPTPIRSKITVTVNGTITKKMTVYFAPNCKETPGYCLKHPIQASWYIRTILADKFRSWIFKERQ